MKNNYESQLKQKDEEIDDINKKYNDIKEVTKGKEEEIAKITDENKKLNNLVNENNKALEKSQKEIDELKLDNESKDKEIEQLNKELNQIKQEKELLILEYETYKSDSKSDLDNIKNLFQTQINSLLEKIRMTDNLDKFDNQSNDNTQLKNELDATRRQISDLNNEIDKLRHEKELLTIEKTDFQLNLMKMQDSQNFNQKKLQADLNKAYGDLENMQNECKRLNDNLMSKQLEINDLLKDRENLKTILNNRETEDIETRGMIQSFKNIVKMKKKKKNNYLKEKELNFNEMIIKERKEKEEYENQIKDLNDKLAEAKSDNMIKKENEIKQLREELNKYKNQKMDDNDLYVELEEMKKKKNEYKLQCKMANENIEAIIKKLNEQQKKDFMTIIKRTKEKYLK